ncbi:DNA polymerase subunit gamma-2 isoform 1-T3 [Anomaloglossus baeobatrachus]|uniref:DNA polymerase subunit gamma-2 n=1 Tax=Anomaloglossus baeobatrachus TaxID=238106 RepID=UPI003F5022EE
MATFSPVGRVTREIRSVWRSCGGIRLYAASPSSDRIRDLLFALCQRRRFILGEELSAASVLGGRHSLGPLGIKMKKNLISEWWNMVTQSRERVLAIDTPIWGPVQPSPSGHPDHNGQHDALRQDLLQGALSHYVSCLELVNHKLPFGVAEVGKCFHAGADLQDDDGHLARPGERTAAALCWFCSAKSSSQWRDYWVRHRLLWWRRFAQIPSGFSCSDGQDADGAKTLQINYRYPWGPEPVETLHTLDDSALTQMHAGAGTKLHGRDGRRSVVPHAVWLSSDLDRGLLAYLADALHLVEDAPLRGREPQRTVLKIHPALAPVMVALDLGKGPTVDLRLVCRGLESELRGSGISVWPGYLDALQTPMEQLFTKYDEMGAVFTVLVSDVTLQSGLLHLRSRDTGIKETLHISKLPAFLTQHKTAAARL